MSKKTYIIITILLSLIILPTLWSVARGSLFKVSAPAAKGLVGHWALDNITGAKDKTPYGNNGTGAGGVTIGGATDQHEQANRATSFDGTDDYVGLGTPSLLNFLKPATFSVWVKTTNDVGQVIFRLGNGANANDREQLEIKTGPVTGTLTNELITITREVTNTGSHHIVGYTTSNRNELFDGIWHHIVVVAPSSGNMQIYLDGNSKTVTVGQVGNGAGWGIVPNTTMTFLGARQSNDTISSYFNGSISDVRVYNRALSATEITQLYNSYRPVRQISSLYKGLVLDMPLAQADLKSATTIADKTPYSNTGTLVGSPSFTTDRHGQSNKAMSFNGTTQAITLGQVMNFTGDMSVALWVKKDGTDLWGAVSKRGAGGDQWQIWGRPDVTDQKLHFWNGTTIIGGNSNVSNNVWHHIAVTRSGTTIIFYLDGVSDGSTTLAVPASSTANVAIQEGAGEYSNGSIANVLVYNRALSSTEVTSLYNSYRPVRQISSLYKGLVLDMPLAQADLKSATTIADKTPYSNIGTLVGSPTFTTDRKGQSNKAMSFNGSSQYILNSTADWRSSDSQGTISAWIKTSGANGSIFSSADSGSNSYYFLFRVSSNYIAIQQANNDPADIIRWEESVINDNQWHHVVVTSNGSTYSIYVDGVSRSVTVTQGANTGDWFADTPNRDNLAIGSLNRLSVDIFFNGSIANVKVWNRALSATEVGALYQSYK